MTLETETVTVPIQEILDMKVEIALLRHTVAFFASVIKSGEDWSEVCEETMQNSLAKR